MTSVAYSLAIHPLSPIDEELASPSFPLPPFPPSEHSPTPDSMDVSWLYDSPSSPSELYNFIFGDDEPFLFDLGGLGGDSAQTPPADTAQLFELDEDEQSTDSSTQTVGEEASAAALSSAYAPIVRSVRSRRVACQSACVHCRRAKTRCDGERPCSRCAAQGRTSECVDRPAEEIERGKENRKRKPRVHSKEAAVLHAANLRSALPPPAAAAQPAFDSPLSTLLPAVTHFPPLDSVSARLALGQTAILRQTIIARINRLCACRPLDDPVRCRFIRAVHLLFLKMSDAMSAAHFDLFINGRSGEFGHTERTSATPTPLPACLQAWARVDTRPIYLDWSSSPLLCEVEQPPVDVPTVRIRTGPAAQRALEAWEERQRLTAPQQQPMADELQPSDVIEIFSCLGVADTAAIDKPVSSRSKPASSTAVHASWCPVFSGVPLPSSAAPDPSTQQLSSTAPSPCVCFAATALPTSMQINAAFERLMGYSQAEIRAQSVRRGGTVLMDWYLDDSWWGLHALLASHALTDKRLGYRVRAFVVVRTRWGAEVPCTMEKRIEEGGGGFSHAVMTFTPIAQLAATA